jgi:hypothetical protein
VTKGTEKTPLKWAHKVAAAFLIAMTLLYVWLVVEAMTVEWPVYPTTVAQVPVVETVLFPVVVTAVPTDEPTPAPTKTLAPFSTSIPTQTPLPPFRSAFPARGGMETE